MLYIKEPPFRFFMDIYNAKGDGNNRQLRIGSIHCHFNEWEVWCTWYSARINNERKILQKSFKLKTRNAIRRTWLLLLLLLACVGACVHVCVFVVFMWTGACDFGIQSQNIYGSISSQMSEHKAIEASINAGLFPLHPHCEYEYDVMRWP